MHGRPTATELIDTVGGFPLETVLPDIRPDDVFHPRVVLNAFDKVERELRDGTSSGDAHAQRMADPRYSDDPELAAAIRSCSLPGRHLDAIRLAFLAAVEARLLVAILRYVEDYDQ